MQMLSWPALREAAELAIYASGARHIARWRSRGGTLVLAYHNIVPRGTPIGGDPWLQQPVDDFAAQLDALMETHDVIPLREALEPPRASPRRPRAVITFDDAYRGAVTCGVEELARRSLPATIFVAPAFLGGRSFWWDQLTRPGAELADDVREFALTTLRGDGDAICAWAGRNGLPSRQLPDYALCASEEELRAAIIRADLTVGSHSWSHLNLTQLGSAQLAEELTRPLAWLRSRFDVFVPFLTYPYGLSSAAVEAAAAVAGYAAAFRVTGGWIRDAGSNTFAIPRFNVPSGITSRAFALRTDGMLCP